MNLRRIFFLEREDAAPEWLIDDVSSSDAQGGLIYIFIAPLSHGIWLLLAAPYLIRTYINKSR